MLASFYIKLNMNEHVSFIIITIIIIYINKNCHFQQEDKHHQVFMFSISNKNFLMYFYKSFFIINFF